MVVATPLKTETNPLANFLREHLRQLAECLLVSETNLNEKLRDYLRAWRFSIELDSPFQDFMLVGGQAIDNLTPAALNKVLAKSDLPPAQFMGEPAPFFDCVLVPIGSPEGSGYLFFWSANLKAEDIYYLLAHALGHLALGHLRKGDVFSHWDVLSALRHPAGAVRRWDRVVQTQLNDWYSPLDRTIEPELKIDWQVEGFAEAFNRLLNYQLDDNAQLILAAAQRYVGRVIELDFEIERDAELFPHQWRGAVELALRLPRLGVALLADSVGLGKTRTTATLIRLMRQNGLINQAAILTPQKLEHNWRVEFQKLRLTVGEPGNITADVIVVNKDKFKRLEPAKARDMVQSCELLIIEEAHQDLRNMSNKFHRNLREAANGKYGLLVTATPWNNRRADIFAMLFPFASPVLGTERPEAWECFGMSLKEGRKKFEETDAVFQQIYAVTALQRTRRQLRESGDKSGVFYAPRRPYLVSVPYSPEQAVAFAHLLDKIQELRLPQVNFLSYLASDNLAENQLSGIQRFQLLKRAESSMTAFQISLDNLAHRGEELLRELYKLAAEERVIETWLQQRLQIEQIEDTETDELNHENNDGSKPRYNHQRAAKLVQAASRDKRLQAIRLALMRDCAHDLQLIKTIKAEFKDLWQYDPKLEAVQEQVNEAIKSGYKVLCISQYADTARAVQQHLLKQPLLRKKGIGLVTGSAKDGSDPIRINDRAATREAVLSRFAPQSWTTKTVVTKGNPNLPDNIDILVGSDTLSVGQNLQDARVLLNLDLCWNPMQHEQRIGRIDRPRHASDSAPLDIYYFPNLDLIESELRLYDTIQRRLTSTYHDTEFDDEILPGYFDMIEQFRRLRQAQSETKIFVAEANTILEDIAERSAKPENVTPLNNELEREALLHLQKRTKFISALDYNPDHLLVSAGQLNWYDQNNKLRSHLPSLALVAELEFKLLDANEQLIGEPTFRHCYLEWHASLEQVPDQTEASQKANLVLDVEHVAPAVEAWLAPPGFSGLDFSQKQQLQSLLVCLEEFALRELTNQRNNLKRVMRRSRMNQPQKDTQAQAVAVRLISLKCLCS